MAQGNPSLDPFLYLGLHYRTVTNYWRSWITGTPFIPGISAHYANENALKAAWPNYPFLGETWQTIQTPPLGDTTLRYKDFFHFQHDMAVKWTSRIVTEIHKYDNHHLITIGMLNWSVPFENLYSAFSPYYLTQANSLLDFISIHTYPDGTTQRNDLLDLELRGAFVGRPVVIEETNTPILFNSDLPTLEADFSVFKNYLTYATKSVAGTFTFYGGGTPDDMLNAAKDPSNPPSLQAVFQVGGESMLWYSTFTAGLISSPPVRQAGVVVIPASIADLKTSPTSRQNVLTSYQSAKANGKLVEIQWSP